jgi:hypothetical protein
VQTQKLFPRFTVHLPSRVAVAGLRNFHGRRLASSAFAAACRPRGRRRWAARSRCVVPGQPASWYSVCFYLVAPDPMLRLAMQNFLISESPHIK